MVGDAVAEERQLHSYSRIVAMNTSYNAARSGTNSHEYVALRRTVWRCADRVALRRAVKAGAWGQLAEQARTAESRTGQWAC